MFCQDLRRQQKRKQLKVLGYEEIGWEQECITHWRGLESKTFLRKVIALRILVGRARAVRRQIGNTGLGRCNRRPLEKITALKFRPFGAAPSRESSFFKNKFDYCIATD